jgi:hypothetical protein
MEVISLDNTSETLTLGCTAYNDTLADCKNACSDNITNCNGRICLNPELTQVATWLYTSGTQVALLRAGQTIDTALTKSYLRCRIAISFDRTYLCHNVWLNSQNCHRNNLTLFIEELGHTDLTAENTLYRHN